MADATFRAVITAVDKATGPLRQISGRIAGLTNPLANVSQSVRGLGEAMTRLGNNMGLPAVRNQAAQAGQALQTLRGGVNLLLPALGGLGAALSARGLIGLAQSAADAATGLGDSANALDGVARQIGASNDQLRSFRVAADAAGVGSSNVSSGLLALQQNMISAAQGGNQEFASMLDRLGIRLRDAQGRIRPVTDVFQDLGRTLEGTRSHFNRVQIAQEAFGSAGLNLIPMLTKLREATASIRANDEIAGRPLFTPEDIERGKAMREAFSALNTAVTDVGHAIGRNLFGALTSIARAAEGFLVQNREIIASGFSDAFNKISDAVRSINWQPIIDGARSLVSGLGTLIERVGGLGNVLIGLGTFGAAGIIGALGKGLIALGALAFSPLNLAVMAFAGAAYVIYNNWEGISEWLKGAWETVGPLFTTLWQAIREAAEFGGRIIRAVVGGAVVAAQQLIDNWGGIQDFFRGLWDGVVGIFESAWQRIRPIVDAIREAASWVGRQFGSGQQGQPGQPPQQQLGPRAPSVQQQQRDNWRNRSGAQPPPPGGWRDSMATPAPGAAGAAGRVVVDFRNVPQGARVSPEGASSGLSVDVGYAFG
ncbi:MAG: phage tail tape measure protein [Acetobacteraceae bacterium]|nr:phage tail tape measure protein [Acetobacteraceae bacterium]